MLMINWALYYVLFKKYIYTWTNVYCKTRKKRYKTNNTKIKRQILKITVNIKIARYLFSPFQFYLKHLVCGNVMHLIAKLRVMYLDTKVVANPHAIIRIKNFFLIYICFLLPCWKCCACGAAMVSCMQLDFNLWLEYECTNPTMVKGRLMNIN